MSTATLPIEQEFSYYDFEGCIAYFKTHPPEGATVELDFSPEEITHVEDKAASYGCTRDVFLTAVLVCFINEKHREEFPAVTD